MLRHSSLILRHSGSAAVDRKRSRRQPSNQALEMRVIVYLRHSLAVDDVGIARKTLLGIESEDVAVQSALSNDSDAGAGIEARGAADPELFDGP